MANLSLTGAGLGSQLMELVNCDNIQPGDAPSYQTCKIIYEFHPLGAKLAEVPVAMAMSQAREVTITEGPEERVTKAFLKEWDKLGIDKQIYNVETFSRVYGVASIAMLVDGEDSDTPVDWKTLWKKDISFSIFDPLNTSGSLVINQNPNAPDFLKTTGSIRVQDQTYHKSRVSVRMNESSIYLAWTSSAYGYVGRSVYQRTLYPLKSYLQTMKTDDMVARKAGLIIAKMKQPGSIVDNLMQVMAGAKRSLLKEAGTDNVLQIEVTEDIAAIDLTNVNTAMQQSRKDILNNIASGAGMPAILVNEETFAEGFGEGTEDAKQVARFIDLLRKDMRPLYDYFDGIVRRRAWNEEFYAAIQKDFPEYKDVEFDDAFYQWEKSFEAPWPSLLTEPDSEKSKVDDVKLKATLAVAEVLIPQCDPTNKAAVFTWLMDNLNAMENIFSSPLLLDAEEMANYVPPQPEMGGGQDEEPVSTKDSTSSVGNLIKLARKDR